MNIKKLISYLVTFCMVLTTVFSYVSTTVIVANATGTEGDKSVIKTHADGDADNPDEEDETDLDADAYCAKFGHSLEELKKAETVSECGGGVTQDCWHCETCGKYFSDEDATSELNKEDIEIPENHTFNEDDVKYEWIMPSADEPVSEDGEDGEGGEGGSTTPSTSQDSGDDIGSGVQAEEGETTALAQMPIGARAYVVCTKCGAVKEIQFLDITEDIDVITDDGEVEDCTKISGSLTYTVRGIFSDGVTLEAQVKKTASSEHDFITASDVLVSEANCTESAKYKAKCAYCKVVSDDITIDSSKEDEQALGHDYTKGQASDQFSRNGGCTGDYYFAICDRCGEVSETEDVLVAVENAKHEGKATLDESTVKKATCKEEGYTGDKFCDVCGDLMEKGEVIPKAEHTYTTKVADTPIAKANCEHGDLYPLICDVCNAVATDETHVKEVGSGNGKHDYSKHQIGDLITEATCTEPAVYGLKCDICGDTSKEETVTQGEPNGHSYDKRLVAEGEEGIKQEASCTKPEIRYLKCDNCDFINKTAFKQTKEALGHTTELKNAKPATCTEAGYTGDEVCTRCNETIKQGKSIKATGHQNTEIQNQKDATCTENGYTGDTFCNDCQTVIEKGEEIKALEHDFSKKGSIISEATCTEVAKYKAKCSKCGEESDEDIIEEGKALGHSWDNGKVTKIATTTAEGERTFTCTRCGEARTESIAKISKIVSINAQGKGGKKVASVKWSPVSGASKYQVFEARCGKSFKSTPTTVTTNPSISRKGLKKGICYKYYIKAFNKDGSLIGKSFVVHIATKGGKYTNAKSISVKSSKVSIKKGKSYKMSNKLNKAWKGSLVTHSGKFRYTTSNAKVAVVKGGKIAGKGKGTATIRVIASDGVSKNIKVTVK